MSRGESFSGEERPSQAPNFNKFWSEFSAFPIDLSTIEDEEGELEQIVKKKYNIPTLSETARTASKKGDRARTQIAIKRRLREGLKKLQKTEEPLTVASLEKLDVAALGDIDSHAGDIVSSLYWEAYKKWETDPANQEKLATMEKDDAFKLHQQEFDDAVTNTYAWEQILRRLFYGPQ